MKSIKSIMHISIMQIAAALLGLLVFSSAGFAATNPLSGPGGLAVDSKGNLWVANTDGNNILKYNTSYMQQTKATITAGVSLPTGVAFDTSGNLWVTNFASSNGGTLGSISEYTNGVQNTAASITNGIVGPHGIAIDGLNNIWVSNDGTFVTVYAMTAPNTLSSKLISTFSFDGFPVNGITVSGGAFVWGAGTTGTVFISPQRQLVNALSSGFIVSTNNTGNALATAANGQVYIGNSDGTVNIYNPATNTVSQFLQLSFVPFGIAIDNVRGRIYISNDATNSISVYSTAGVLLHTIQ